MKLPKLTLGTLALTGVAAYFLYPRLMREIQKTQSFIGQKITKFKPLGLDFDSNGKIMAKFTTAIEIENKNTIAFPIQDLGVKLFYKAGSGQFTEVASSIPNFGKYLIPGAKNEAPGIARIQDINLLVNPTSIPGLVKNLGTGVEFQVQSNLKVYGIKLSTTSSYKL